MTESDLCPIWTGQPCGALLRRDALTMLATCTAGHVVAEEDLIGFERDPSRRAPKTWEPPRWETREAGRLAYIEVFVREPAWSD